MVIYHGVRTNGRVEVYKDRRVLSPEKSLRRINHSPTGFEWGYGGSGPAQLAVALLIEEFSGDEPFEFYQDFKWDIVAKFPHAEWTLTSEQIQDWMTEAHRKRFSK